MAEELKTNNMARTTGRSGFKMKSGNAPLRKESRDWTGSTQGDTRSIKRAKLTSDISSFFSGLGKSVSDAASKIGTQLKKGQKERGIFSETGRAEKKEMRKTGESKYQYDVRKRRETAKAAETIIAEGGEEPVGAEIEVPAVAQFESKTFGRGGGDPYSYRTKEGGGFEFQSLGRGGRTKGEWYPAKGGVEKIQAAYEKALKTTPIEKKSPTKKRSGFKMKNSPAKIYSKPKGKRTEY